MSLCRRSFLKSAAVAGATGIVTPATSSIAAELGIEVSGNERRVRAAAIQMTIRHGDVDANLETAERLGRKAIEEGATWITFPEFFTSGFGAGNDPAQIDAHRPLDGEPTALLKSLAKDCGGAVGGSFLAQRNQDTYNTYVLALSDERVLTHDKDTPSMGTEASNYIGGDDDGFLAIDNPDINVGIALCWEFVRSRTARRLRGRVDLMMGGSAYLDGPALAELVDAGTLRTNRRILDEMPGRMARMVGAPVVHANPVGRVNIADWQNPERVVVYDYMGNSQIVNSSGEILAKRDRKQGEGVVVAEVTIGSKQPTEEVPDRFWIPDVPDLYPWAFGNRSEGAQIYYTLTRPHRNKRGVGEPDDARESPN